MSFTAAVLVNNYNNERFIKTCVDSVLAQTRPAEEVIVYDDGSTDQSLPQLRAYGHRITLIEGVRQPNRPSRANQANAVYQAFLKSTSDFLFLLDGDDAFYPTKVARMLAAVGERRGISLVQSPCTLIDENGATLGFYRDPRFHVQDVKAEAYRQNDVDFFYPTSAMVVSRATLQRILPLDMSTSPELACDTRIAMCTPMLGEIITLDEPLAFWRRHRNSHFSSVERARFYQAKQTFRRVKTFNTFAPALAVPPLKLWRNRRFLRQICGAILPSFLRHRLRKNESVTLPSSA